VVAPCENEIEVKFPLFPIIGDAGRSISTAYGMIDPGNKPCTVYKYKPELTPGSINQGSASPSKCGSTPSKERKKGLDGQKNGSPAQSGDKSKREKERKQTTQGRDGRTARRHHKSNSLN